MWQTERKRTQPQMPYGKDWCLHHLMLQFPMSMSQTYLTPFSSPPQHYWQKLNGLLHRIPHQIAQLGYAHIYKAISHHSLCCNVSRKGSCCSSSTSTLFNNAAHQEHLLREIWYELSQRWIDQTLMNTWVDLIYTENKRESKRERERFLDLHPYIFWVPA